MRLGPDRRANQPGAGPDTAARSIPERIVSAGVLANPKGEPQPETGDDSLTRTDAGGARSVGCVLRRTWNRNGGGVRLIPLRRD
jgi:hypothetical protein